MSDLPSGWQATTYGAVLEETHERRGQNADLPVLSVTKTRGPMLASERFGKPLHGRDLGNYRVARRGTIVADPMLLWDGSIGRQGVVDAGLVSPDYRVYEVRDHVSSDFMQYVVRDPSMLRHYQGSARGTNVRRNRIARADFLRIPLRLPPLPEQRKIAAILLSLNEMIERTKAVIASLQTLKNAMMRELLIRGVAGRHVRFKQTELGEIPWEWKIVALDERLSRLIDYRGKTPTKTSAGVPLITAKNVRQGYVDPEPREYIAEADYASWMRRGIPDGGDVLFTTEAPLGNAAAFPMGRVALAQRVVTFCPDRSVLHPGYLLWQLLGPAFQSQVQAHATGSTVKGIKQRVLRKLPIAVPPLDEQRDIAIALDAIQNRIDSEQRFHTRAIDTKSAMAAALLSGDIRVVTDEDVG